jgi:ankyrin repeat protein
MDYTEHFYYIFNNWRIMKSLKKLEELDIDNINDIRAKILLSTYYNYLDKLKSFDLMQLNNAKSMYGSNVYLLAAYCGHLKIMEYLEENGFDIHIKNTNNENAYLLAVESGQIQIMRILESKDIDIHIKNDTYGNNAYLLAVLSGQIQIMDYLEEKGFDIHIKNILYDNAYLIAVEQGQIQIMDYLEEKGIDIHIKNINGDNAYLIATESGYIQIMDYLEEKGIDIHIKNINGDNAYLLATELGYLEIMKYLEEKDFDIHIENIYGNNAYMLTTRPDVKTHLLTLGFTEDGKIDIEYERKMKKYIKILNDDCEKDIDYECYICYSKIIVNNKFVKCGYKHAMHNSCYKSHCKSKNEITCECLFCLTSLIL